MVEYSVFGGDRDMRTVKVVMMVVICCAILVGAMPGCRHYTPHDHVLVTRGNLVTLHAAIIQFKVDTGRYPTREEGLRSLIEKPGDVVGWNTGGYLDIAEVPKDAWGRDFVYIFEPADGIPFTIVSYGADGKPGGEGYDADLSSADLR